MYNYIITMNRNRGFTLIEVMIALLIFAIVTIICTRGINNIILIQNKQRESMDKLSEIQMIQTLFQRDLMQAIDRPIRINDQIISGFIGGNNVRLANELFELTRMGVPNPDVNQRRLSSLRRVGYFFKKDTLIRSSWSDINNIEQQKPASNILSTDVKSIKVQFIDVQKNPMDNWSSIYPVNLQTVGKTWEKQADSLGLPPAVQVKLTLKDNSEYDWWFLLPGGRRAVN